MSIWAALNDINNAVNPNKGQGRGRKVSAERKVEIEKETARKAVVRAQRVAVNVGILATGTKQVVKIVAGNQPVIGPDGQKVMRTVLVPFGEQIQSLVLLLVKAGFTPAQVAQAAPEFAKRTPEALTADMVKQAVDGPGGVKTIKGYSEVSTEAVLECLGFVREAAFELHEGSDEPEEGVEFDLELGDDEGKPAAAAA